MVVVVAYSADGHEDTSSSMQHGDDAGALCGTCIDGLIMCLWRACKPAWHHACSLGCNRSLKRTPGGFNLIQGWNSSSEGSSHSHTKSMSLPSVGCLAVGLQGLGRTCPAVADTDCARSTAKASSVPWHLHCAASGLHHLPAADAALT